MGKHLVIVGAGHAHLTILKNLRELKNAGFDVTVVSSSSLHYYSGMGPGMLSGIYRPEELKEPFYIRHLEEFIKEITSWEDFDDDEPSQRIGFHFNLNQTPQDEDAK